MMKTKQAFGWWRFYEEEEIKKDEEENIKSLVELSTQIKSQN